MSIIEEDERGYRRMWDGTHWRKLDTLGGPVVRPTCYNRAPLQAGREHHVFNRETGRIDLVLLPNSWFQDRCATWEGTGIGPKNERYPVAHNFNCVGCRWLPKEYENEAAQVAAASSSNV